MPYCNSGHGLLVCARLSTGLAHLASHLPFSTRCTIRVGFRGQPALLQPKAVAPGAHRASASRTRRPCRCRDSNRADHRSSVAEPTVARAATTLIAHWRPHRPAMSIPWRRRRATRRQAATAAHQWRPQCWATESFTLRRVPLRWRTVLWSQAATLTRFRRPRRRTATAPLALPLAHRWPSSFACHRPLRW
jgi:hypothetical protein